MKSLRYLSLALLGLMTASCVEEDLDACPPEGGAVAVTVRVEKFQARPPYRPEELEERFAQRIRSLRYLLYAGGELIERGALNDLPTQGNSYLFRHEALPFGDYRLLFVANTPAETMTGTPEAPGNRFIVYRPEPDGDDHFRAELPLKVDCPCSNEFETVLQRIHGVTRFRFENLPREITAVEVSLDRVGERIPLSGEPDRGREVVKRVATSELGENGSFTLGTFSTLPGERSSWRLKLFARDAEPVYDRVVTDTLRIERNQLLDLRVRFEDRKIEYSVSVDTSWDGSNDGGGGVTQ